MSRLNQSSQSGFTLVELVVVIILLAIVSVFAVSRFTGGSNYQLPTVQDQAISVIRQIQLGRMQSNVADLADLSSYYRLTITDNCLGAQVICGPNTTPPTDISAVVMSNDVSFSPSPALLDFDLFGRPSISPFEITLTDNRGNTAQLCVEAEGYIRRGGCI